MKSPRPARKAHNDYVGKVNAETKGRTGHVGSEQAISGETTGGLISHTSYLDSHLSSTACITQFYTWVVTDQIVKHMNTFHQSNNVPVLCELHMLLPATLSTQKAYSVKHRLMPPCNLDRIKPMTGHACPAKKVLGTSIRQKRTEVCIPKHPCTVWGTCTACREKHP
jgi:hypothetical protein